MPADEPVSEFADLVAQELERARAKHQPIHSLHEGYAVILEEMDEFKAEIWKKQSKRKVRRLLAEAVQIAAMVQRTVEDCALLYHLSERTN